MVIFSFQKKIIRSNIIGESRVVEQIGNPIKIAEKKADLNGR